MVGSVPQKKREIFKPKIRNPNAGAGHAESYTISPPVFYQTGWISHSNPSDQALPAIYIKPAILPAALPVAAAAPLREAVETAEVRKPRSSLPVQTTFDFDLTTQNIVRPSDSLRQSIEGFLLDQRSPHTRRAYGKDLKRFVQFLHLRKHQQGVEAINRTVLIAYKELLVSEGLEHTTVDRHLATLRSFFRWLVDDGHISRSPAEGVRFLNPKRISKTLGFNDEEVRKVLSIPDLHSRTGSLHYAILMVLFYCGLRRSEVCELRTTNLGTERDHTVLRLRGKGNAERMIVVIPPVLSAIQHYFYISRRDLSDDEYLFTPIRNNRTGVLNKAIDPSMIFYIVRKYAKKAGISNRVSPHSCRATAISNARDHNVPDRAIQEFAGWASPDMITRYDKRRTSVENSASHNIYYGAEKRSIPIHPTAEKQPEQASEKKSEKA
jgi:integrase/recombinase XerD